VDLLVASSCTPPFTPVELLDGEPCLDGGMMDNVPIATVADVPGQTLVLATRRYKGLAPVFVRDGRMYVQPSERVAASSWDYTSPAKYQKTYDLGRRDGEQFLKTFALGRHQGTGLRAAVPESAEGTAALPPEQATPAPAGVAPEDAAADGTVVGRQVDKPVEKPAGSVENPVEEPVEKPVEESAGDAGAASPRAAADEGVRGPLDVSAKLAAYRDPIATGTAEDLNASQPEASYGQLRSGRWLRASNI
jgi:predicted acylesterase/phospholipase RssA